MIFVLRSENIKKTRKPHVCFGCLKIIPEGSPAHIQVNTDMGIGTIYTHIACEQIMNEIIGYYDEMNEGCVLDELDGLGFKGTPEEYIKAAFGGL